MSLLHTSPESAEPSDRKSSVSSPVRVRVLSAGLILVFLGLGYGSFSFYTKIKQAEEMKSRWAGMEEKIGAAEALIADHTFLKESQFTLQGWRKSRYDWAAFFNAVFADSQGEAGEMRIARLYFDEEMRGMRNQIPGATSSISAPLSRTVALTFNGQVQAEHPAKRLTRFIADLRGNPMVAPMLDTIELEDMKPLLDRNRKVTDQGRFFINVQFVPRELRP